MAGFARQVFVVRHPCGQFESWQRDDRLVVVKNPDYWRGTPHVDEVVFRVFKAADPAVQTFSHSVGVSGNNQTIANGRFWIALKPRGERDVSASGCTSNNSR